MLRAVRRLALTGNPFGFIDLQNVMHNLGTWEMRGDECLSIHSRIL